MDTLNAIFEEPTAENLSKHFFHDGYFRFNHYYVKHTDIIKLYKYLKSQGMATWVFDSEGLQLRFERGKIILRGETNIFLTSKIFAIEFFFYPEIDSQILKGKYDFFLNFLKKLDCDYFYDHSTNFETFILNNPLHLFVNKTKGKTYFIKRENPGNLKSDEEY